MEMLFTLFLTLLCIDTNNGAPPNNDRKTITSARKTDEYAETFRSHRLQNSDLFFFGKQPEFHIPANNELNRRIKVKFIDSSEKLKMEQHYPFNTIKSSDFEQLEGWQPNIFIAFNDKNSSTIDTMIDDQLQSFRCFYVMPSSNGFEINWKYSHNGNLENYKRGLIIPMMPDTNVD
ncbi:unnamed protein product, partial [Onchocerca ochengi]|uniref:Secreted protein n=1 Tax=Onchocerca ochengi TaxID=42157 RepID=A0A182EXE5_ONCOC